MQPQVSFIIPAYNAEQYLQRSVTCALQQRDVAVEVVVVDDGSTDGTAAVADQLAANDERVRVLHQSNSGAAEARRQGVLMARGEYICFMDADDEMPREALSQLVQHCLDDNVDVAYSSYLRCVGDSKTHITHHVDGVISGEQWLDYLLDRRCMCALWGCVSRRALWQDDVFPPRDVNIPNEDVLMNVCLSAHVKQVGFYNQPLYNYNSVPTSLSVTGRLFYLDNWKRFFALLEDNLQRRGLLEQHRADLLAMKLERLAFNVYPLDTTDPWVHNILHDSTQRLSRRSWVLQHLLRHPRLCRWCVTTNRRLKHSL